MKSSPNLARDLNLKRNVALKLLPDHFVRDRDRLKRFKREAEMLARIQHPNVATLFDYDREARDEPRFLVMEYVQGETLAARLERGRLTAQDAAPLFRQIAEALHAAHTQGIIHRDLKPSNIKITPEGVVKVLDFGLAKPTPKEMTVAESALGSFNGTPSQLQTLTRPQMILGTPGYMSPEQVRGDKELDQRTDWWAFGCMLYEALSGQNPFRAHSAADTQAAILTKEPDWKTLPLKTPPALVKLVHQCLEKDLHQRVRKVTEVLPLLENIKAPSGLTLTAIRLKRAAPQLGFAAACLALLVSVYVGYLWLKPQPHTVLAVIAGKDAEPCERGRSEAIAKFINDKLKDFRGVQVVSNVASERSQPFLMIDADLTQAALAAEANTILKVAATNCADDGKHSIKYSLTSRQGEAIANGTATDLTQILLSVVNTLNLQGNAAALQATSNEAEYYRAIALLDHYDNEQSVQEAIDILHRLESLTPANMARIKAGLGWGYYLKNYLTKDEADKSKAVSNCDQATSSPTDDPDVLLLCGKVSVALGNMDKAISNFNQVLQKRSNDPDAILALARAYEFKGEAKPAEEHYLRALSLRPAYWDIYNQLGAFYFDRGEFRKAEEYWRKVTDLLDTNPCGFNNLGSALLYQEQYDLAIIAYRDALKRRPLTDTYHSLGTAYLFRGACDSALEIFQNGKELDPNDPEFWGAIGDALSCASSQRSQAASAYDKAIELLKKSDLAGEADYLSLLAEWYARRGDKKIALQKIEDALQSEPENYDCIVSAVRVYKLTNEADKLWAQFEKAVQNRKSLFEVTHDPLLTELIQQPKYRNLIEQHK
jgi:serine/threonine protein kinase/tetratricopeptide (TPR) repeat protein